MLRLSAGDAGNARSWPCLHSLKDPGGAHSAADAHADKAISRVASAHLVQDAGRQLGAGAAERVAKRDGAPVDVQAFGVDRQLLETRKHLGGKRFVQLDEADLVKCQAGEL